MDVAESEMAEYADADISITATYDAETGNERALRNHLRLDRTGLNVALQLP